MQKLITILTLLLISQVLRAQAPQATSYQAVIRNSSGNVLSNQLVKVRFSIRDSAANGTVVYQETQTPTTNAQGLVNLFAGKGTAVTGTFAGINWGNKSKFLQTEIDIAGGNNYTDMGTMQLMSVPYALYSNVANTATTATTAANGNPNGTAVGEMLYWNGTTWVKLNPGSNGQNLTFCNGVPQWGPCLILPTVLTGSITAKTAITATVGGNVTDSGSRAITARGICYSTTINPTIANTKTASGTNVIGAFTVSLTGLSALTTYHYRAYATTSVGTSYGADSVFTTNAATVATLTTTAASAITGTTATSGGNITNDNGATITARGICWSTTANPTIALTTKTVNGTGTGAFTSSITGLTVNTTYYVRAYATNSAGTAYGTQVSFTTASAVANLPRVTIGTQVWSSKNLDVARYRNGDIIPQVTDATQWANLTTGAWCWYNNDSATYAATYGRLYNWYAVNDARGLAPQGWHVPSDGEWNKLVKYLDAGADTTCSDCYQSATAGGSMKSTTNWYAPNIGATNSSGFSGFPGGLRYNDIDGTFSFLGYAGGWWSSQESDDLRAWPRLLSNNISDVGRDSWLKSFGFSIRCIRDTSMIAAIPSLITIPSTNITNTTTLSGGSIINDNGTSITTRGVCWGINQNPTIALPTKTSNGVGSGSFTSSITGLTSNTTYYLRAYATNSIGTSYGNQQTFTTASSNVTMLPNVAIGSQVWSSKNLDEARYRNGDIIPQVTDPTQWANLTTGAWCWFNNDSVTNAATYGRLYNWYAVNDARGLAPQGWHIPSDAEWNKLIKIIDPYADTTQSCGNTASTAMKNTSGWYNGFNGTNSSGFAGLPGGYRNNYYGFIDTSGHWWSSTQYNLTSAWYCGLIYFYNCSYRNFNEKSVGLSVRCLRDTIITITIPTLTTNTSTNITTTTATSGGNITSDGGATITAKGICWSSTANPNVSLTTKTNKGTGIGAFTSAITGLTANTIYYVRSYATNIVGTFYGAQQTFTTLPATIPIVSTTAISIITTTLATTGGNITSDGGATITARGVCWSTTANPTVSLATKTVNGIGTGAFISKISGLTANTLYYVRAYATNNVGTVYGAQQIFTTLSAVLLPSVTIGDQVWTDQNLSVSRYRNGDIIPQVTSASDWVALTTGAWCWYNNDSATYAATYGRLYNWYAVNDARGLAPLGWHIPNNSEWNKLEKFLDPGADTTCTNCYQSSIAGGAMKSTTGWNSPNTGATNSSGFAGLPGGVHADDGMFYNVGSLGYWWSSTQNFATDAWNHSLYYNRIDVPRISSTKRLGFSVRCVRD